MNEKQIIRAILKRNGKTQHELSEMLGYKKETIGTILRSKSDMGIGKFYRMLSALGYEVVIRKADKTDTEEFLLADNDEYIRVETPAQRKEREEQERISERVAAKELETEQEMAQLKRMMRK